MFFIPLPLTRRDKSGLGADIAAGTTPGRSLAAVLSDLVETLW
jgi:hypothetical protein